jgi:hypothetical protein
MKKIVFILAFVIMATAASAGKFSFGLKIGYNASKLSTSIDSIKSSFNSGLHFGAFFRYGTKVYIQPELYYTIQGGLFENSVSGTVDNWKQKVTVGTIDIPVLVGFKIIDAKIVNWRIMAGPMASIVVNSKIKDVNTFVGPITNSDINKMNWYIQAGTGVDVLFLSLDIRYQLGLNQIIKSAQYTDPSGNPTSTYNLNSKNNMWVVSLGFKI